MTQVTDNELKYRVQKNMETLANIIRRDSIRLDDKLRKINELVPRRMKILKRFKLTCASVRSNDPPLFNFPLRSEKKKAKKKYR